MIAIVTRKRIRVEATAGISAQVWVTAEALANSGKDKDQDVIET